MGNCCKPQSDIPTIENEIDGNICCTNISDSCPSTCCNWKIIIQRSRSLNTNISNT